MLRGVMRGGVTAIALGFLACSSEAPPAPAASSTASGPIVRAVTLSAVTLPFAANAIALPEDPAPLVGLTAEGKLSVDGAFVGDTSKVPETGRPQRLDGLFVTLKRAREDAKEQNPSGWTFPGVVLLEIDARAPVLDVWSVYDTATLAGYPNVSFVVESASPPPRRMRLLASGFYPRTLSDEPMTPDRTLDLAVSAAGGFTLRRFEGTDIVDIVDIVDTGTIERVRGSERRAYPELARRVQALWDEKGLHKEASDRKFDQATLHVAPGLTHGVLIAALDALRQPKRPYAISARTEQISALDVVLTMPGAQ